VIVQATLSFSNAILDAAALGFLGMGAQPPTPEWGTMLAEAREFILRAWWVVTFPGLAILITVLAGSRRQIGPVGVRLLDPGEEIAQGEEQPQLAGKRGDVAAGHAGTSCQSHWPELKLVCLIPFCPNWRIGCGKLTQALASRLN
jgi:hypothetical protein